MNYTGTMRELRTGTADARAVAALLERIDAFAAMAFRCSEKFPQASRNAYAEAAERAAELDVIAERNNYRGAIGSAFEIAHARLAEAEIAARIHN